MSTFSSFLESQLARYRFSFTSDKAAEMTGKGATALRRAIDYAKTKKKVVGLRRGFFLIIPPRFQLLGKMPIQYYITALMEAVDRPYYLSLFSAAKFHGVSHHALQKDFVMTIAPSLKAIDKGPYRINFHVRSLWPQSNLETKKSEAGLFVISSIALTIVDLINYQNKIGGLPNLITSIAELAEDLSAEDLEQLLMWYSDQSDIQRMGYLLEWLNADSELLQIIEKHLSHKTLQEVLLAPGFPRHKGGKNRWYVNDNVELELEL